MARKNKDYYSYFTEMDSDRNNLLGVCRHLMQAEELICGMYNNGITQQERGKLELFSHKIKSATYIAEFLLSMNVARDNASRVKHYRRAFKETKTPKDIPF